MHFARSSRTSRGGLEFNQLGIETVVVRCYHCGGSASIASKAFSAACEHCGKSLDIPDVRIKGHHWGGVLMTCGRIVIGRKAEVTVTMGIASLGADVLGTFTGVLISGGAVTIGPKAVFHGSVWAKSLRIEPGAKVGGGPFVVPCDPLGYVSLNGNRTAVPEPPPVFVA